MSTILKRNLLHKSVFPILHKLEINMRKYCDMNQITNIKIYEKYVANNPRIIVYVGNITEIDNLFECELYFEGEHFQDDMLIHCEIKMFGEDFPRVYIIPVDENLCFNILEQTAKLIENDKERILIRYKNGLYLSKKLKAQIKDKKKFQEISDILFATDLGGEIKSVSWNKYTFKN